MATSTNSDDRFSEGRLESGDLQSKACAIFKRGIATNYITTPARLTFDGLAYTGDKLWTIDPLTFFTANSCTKGQNWTHSHATADPPYIAIVTGQYGLGKTELARQISSKLGDEKTFPVVLARCNADLLSERVLDTDEMIRLLFEQFFAAGELTISKGKKLLEAVQQGTFLLILDGLDEAIFSEQGHNHFFTSLSNMLFDLEHDYYLDFRVLVSVRTEYLSAFDDSTASELVGHLQDGKEDRRRFSIPFLRLDYLTKTQVSRELCNQLGSDLATEIEQHPALMELLDRPLMLRIFCDFAVEQNALVSELPKVRSRIDLIERYVLRFSIRRQLTSNCWTLKL